MRCDILNHTLNFPGQPCHKGGGDPRVLILSPESGSTEGPFVSTSRHPRPFQAMPNSPTGRPWPCPDHDDWVSRTFSHKSGSLDNARRVPLSASNDSGRRCLTRARRQGQARFAGCSRTLASLDPSARPRPLASMLFADRTGPAGRLRAAKSMEAKCRVGTARSSRSDRSAAEEPRSGLTATGRWGWLAQRAAWADVASTAAT